MRFRVCHIECRREDTSIPLLNKEVLQTGRGVLFFLRYKSGLGDEEKESNDKKKSQHERGNEVVSKNKKSVIQEKTDGLSKSTHHFRLLLVKPP